MEPRNQPTYESLPPTPTGRRKVWPVVLAMVVLLGAFAGCTVVLLGDDDQPAGSADPSTRPSLGSSAQQSADSSAGSSLGSVGAAHPSPDPSASASTASASTPVALEAVAERYVGLGSALTFAVESCAAVTPSSGETERLDCRLDGTPLVLVTYAAPDDLAAVRDTHRLDPGTRFIEQGAGQVYVVREDPLAGGEASVYWDSTDALQSASYAARSAGAVRAAFKAAGPTSNYPDLVSDADLEAWMNLWVNARSCERTYTSEAGETEELECDLPGPISVRMVRFDRIEEFLAHRARAAHEADEDGNARQTWHYSSAPETALGYLLDYETDESDLGGPGAVRYWDLAGCNCYAEARLPAGAGARLVRWWEDPPTRIR